MKRLKPQLVVLALTVGLVALVFGLQRPYARYVAEHLRQQLDTVADENAPILLRQAADLGEPGIPVLVAGLGSQRESVARAAKRILREQLEMWSRLPGEAASRRLAILAEALARRIDQFGPTAKADASELAVRIVTWPIDSDAVDRVRVIDCCETVFRTVALPQGAWAENPAIAGQGDGSGGRFVLSEETREAERLVISAKSLPGGGLPIDMLPGGEAPVEETETPHVASTAPPSPDILPRLPRVEPLNRQQLPERLPPVPEDIRSMRGRSMPGQPNAIDRHSQTGALPIERLSRTDSADPQLGERLDTETRAAETIVLMKQLRSGEMQAAANAEAELIRRGFTSVHLELARRLFDPDPRVRKDLAHMLPSLQDVDAVPWLLSLCRDADSDVRLLAITLLMTSGAPGLVEQVEQLARADIDPRIRQQAERLSQQLGGSMR